MMSKHPLSGYTTVVLGGGGVKCIASLGAMQYMYDNNKLSDTHTYIGTSAGTMIGLLLAVGYTPIEVIAYIYSNKIIESLIPVNIISLVKGHGAVKYSVINNSLMDMLKTKIGVDNITMMQLYEKYGKTLVCCTYNVTDNECTYISKDTHPDIDCLQAVRMSSAIPLMFEECLYDGRVYIDGAVADNFPVLYADTDEPLFGITLATTHTHNVENKYSSLIRLITSVSSNFYIKRIVSMLGKNCVILTISLENIEIIDFNQDHKSKLDIFSTGYETCSNFFQSLINEDC